MPNEETIKRYKYHLKKVRDAETIMQLETGREREDIHEALLNFYDDSKDEDLRLFTFAAAAMLWFKQLIANIDDPHFKEAAELIIQHCPMVLVQMYGTALELGFRIKEVTLKKGNVRKKQEWDDNDKAAGQRFVAEPEGDKKDE